MSKDLLVLTDSGLYCPAGDFHIDPWQPVARAILTHAHADHARRGSARYLAATPGQAVLRSRLGTDVPLDTVDYGETVHFDRVKLSFHPAGHILGSAQIRVEHRGQVWVVSGDYKLQGDPTCAAFEPLRCHVFVTESTFGLPIYRWPAQEEVFADINAWWRSNQQQGKTSVLFGYALGKSQRLLAGLDPAIGPIYLHGAVWKLVRDYLEMGVALPPCQYVGEAPAKTDWSKAIVLAPPSAHGSPWVRKFNPVATGLASGWMQIRGTRRRKAVDRGFVLSDHADWPGLLQVIAQTSAGRVWVTHGYVEVLVRYLREQGMDARAVQTRFDGERDDQAEEEEQTTEQQT